jgi:hypothetical protein
MKDDVNHNWKQMVRIHRKPSESLHNHCWTLEKRKKLERLEKRTKLEKRKKLLGMHCKRPERERNCCSAVAL